MKVFLDPKVGGFFPPIGDSIRSFYTINVDIYPEIMCNISTYKAH